MKLTDKFQMENNLKHILYGILATLALTTFAGCSRRIDYTDGEPVMFSELPKEVQDTLIWTMWYVLIQTILFCALLSGRG